MSPAPAAPPARRHRAARSAGGAGRICLPHPRCMALLLAGSGHHRQRARPGRRLHERLQERDGRRRIAVADGGRRRQLVRRAPPPAHSPAQPAPSVRPADSPRLPVGTQLTRPTRVDVATVVTYRTTTCDARSKRVALAHVTCSGLRLTLARVQKVSKIDQISQCAITIEQNQFEFSKSKQK